MRKNFNFHGVLIGPKNMRFCDLKLHVGKKTRVCINTKTGPRLRTIPAVLESIT